MPQILVGVNGELYSGAAGADSWTLHADLGLGIRQTVRPCFATFGNVTIITGKFDRAVAYYDDLDAFYPAGLAKPTAAVSVASGGAGNIDGNAIYYYTFAHQESGITRAESSPGPASATFAASNNSASLTGIPSSAPDSRVTHVYVYRSLDNSIPRRVGTVSIGGTTFNDDMTATLLAQQVPLPVKLDAEGATILDPDARGIPPDTHICFKYNNRCFYGRDPDHHEYIWFSYLNEPESVNRSFVDPNLPPLGTLRTKGGEGVRCFIEGYDELMVGHEGGWDGVQGYGVTTFQVRRMSRRFAPLNHHSAALTGDGIPAWATKEGVAGYDGSFRNLMSMSLRSHWVAEYKADPASYQDAVAADDSDGEENLWKLLIPVAGGPSIQYVWHYEEPGSPVWTFDRENRELLFIGNLAVSTASRAQELHHSAEDGFLRKKDDADADDDGDAYLKHMEVWTKAFLPRGSQGGDDGHGVTCTEITLFVKNENQEVSVTGHGGDDEAWRADPQWEHTIPAGAATHADGVAASPRTSYFTTTPGLNGKTILFKIACDSPVDVEYRGLEFLVTSGHQARP